MANALLPDLALALRGSVASRRREDMSPEDAEAGLLVAVHGMEVLRSFWTRVRHKMERGLEAGEARREAAAADVALRAWDSLLQLVGEIAEDVSRRTGTAVGGLATMPAAGAEIQRMLGEVQAVLELLDRPRKPLNRDMICQSRETFARGAGENIEDIIARRNAAAKP